ncbi:acyl-CoA thioesterase domain-containing protein [Actinomadura scrupuli]|uniref:acyl-CoA thioesterase domain-containing protein n=1 Tax=Actinomadura scrupuli TaxID=559629 RepID=UPI003D9652EB
MAEGEAGEAFFTESGGLLVPAPHARGPWSPDMLHGRLLGGLLARAIEREHSADGLHFARLTVDLYRNSPLVPLRIDTARVRDGRRIRVADATISGARGPIARASAVMLRRGPHPEGEIWAAPVWDVPAPDELDPQAAPSGFHLRPILSGDAAAAGFQSADRHRAWLRETRALVAGESLTPFVRVVLAADMASPMAHFGSAGLKFINADYTVHLSRLPLGDDIGIEGAGHLGDEGVAVGRCTLYDTSGPLGFCATSAIANVRG